MVYRFSLAYEMVQRKRLFIHSRMEAQVVKLLFENWDSWYARLWVTRTLLSAVDPETPPDRLNTLFRDSEAVERDDRTRRKQGIHTDYQIGCEKKHV